MEVRCRDCGHTWEPRYEKTAYEPFGGDRRLRCTSDECHNGKQDGFDIIDDPEGDVTPGSPVAQAKLATQKDTLRAALAEGFETVVGAVPATVEKTGSLGVFESNDEDSTTSPFTARDGLEARAVELYNLHAHLEAVDTLEALEEFQAAATDALEAVDHQRTLLDEHARLQAGLDDLESDRSRLEEAVTELATERDQLEAACAALEADRERERAALAELQAVVTERGFESVTDVLAVVSAIEDLDDRKVALESDLGAIPQEVREAERKEEAYEAGRDAGRTRWQFTVPCQSCLDPIDLDPESELADEAVRILAQANLRHPACPPAPGGWEG